MTGNLENFLHFEQGAGLGGTQAAAAVRQILQWIDCSLPAAIPFPPLLTECCHEQSKKLSISVPLHPLL
jgi:hypothetical protein